MPSPQSLGDAVDGIAKTQMQYYNIPGMTVALGKNGTMLYTKAYGLSNMAAKTVAQPDTIFQIGSITKQFTATLIMKLQEQRKLNVDDSVHTYLPEYGFSSTMTLRMLLTHTSGLANYTSFPSYPSWATNGVAESTVLTAITKAAPLFPPGTQWSYSNSNYFVLGAIIEKLSGQSYATNLAQSIFQPLAMTSTYYSLPPVTQSALGYTGNGSYVQPAQVPDRSAAFAAGALSSDIYDLVSWDNALIHGKVVSMSSFDEMITPVDSSIPGGGAYGFGLALRKFNNRQMIWHNGRIDGFTADNQVFLDSGFTIVVLTNSDAADPDAIALKIIDAVCNSSQFSSTC